ncbi:hypothetical protein BZA05DRAFT_16824 [Tricharina praecox]|uniref:uncharacterized protein n=1 Tax=Tricharina praecox TaxID=43433 RepID=UPI00221FE424|nr:uncharacterized protein BZA05DRAFT_16824 [Tricharina praecox]KAI5858909.1 hypothetical protein BZA05DRAFT_16824 [Tricharina praecox]
MSESSVAEQDPVILSLQTARELRLWMASRNLQNEETVPVSVIQAAIMESESSHHGCQSRYPEDATKVRIIHTCSIPSLPFSADCSPFQRHIISALSIIPILAHTVFVWCLFAHHSNSSYPERARTLGLYSKIASTIVLAVTIIYVCLWNMQSCPGLRRLLSLRIVIAAIVANTLVVVTLFALVEAQKRRYQGEGRTLNIYTLVVSVLLFFAAGYVASYCLSATRRARGAGRIVLV